MIKIKRGEKKKGRKEREYGIAVTGLETAQDVLKIIEHTHFIALGCVFVCCNVLSSMLSHTTVHRHTLLFSSLLFSSPLLSV